MLISKVRVIMLSGLKRDELKRQAITLREQGESYPMIEKKLGVGRSTLSGWLSKLRLSVRAKKVILKRKKINIKLAQDLAAQLKNSFREANQKDALAMATKDIEKVDFSIIVKELLLAMLYLGEGFKRRSVVALGNSNPQLLASFVELLREIYEVPDVKFRCFLYLREDHNDEKEKRYWSRILKIPISFFRKSHKDRRTIGKKTWKGYHGVCAVYCYDARIEKRLTALQEVLLKKLLKGG